MSLQVLDLLRQGRAAGPNVSALDAVMGEDWAIVEFDEARKARLSRAGLRAAHRRDVARSGGGGGGGGGGAKPGAKPQAVVKMIRKGGASDLRGLRAQMAYLSRQGDVPLQRSEAFMGIEVDAEQAAAIESTWRMPPEGSGRADRTSHFLVSFPTETPHGAAERAGRAWAEEMFGSGRFGGDSYDYYTAFHTDRAHPHMHVVVHRRGLEQGAWLKVSQRSDLNYDAMRAVLVEVAAREGIELEATPRLERGVHDRPVPDAEHRRAEAERRAPNAPMHTLETAIRAASAMIHYARRFVADAAIIERDAPEQAAQLRAAADAVAHGRAVTRETYHPVQREPEMSSAQVEERRQEVRANFETMEKGVERMPDGPNRMRVLRQIDELKARSAPLMAEPGGLRASTMEDESGRYRGMDASDGRRAGIKAEADERVKAVAERYGVNGEAMVERYSGGVPSKALAEQFERAEERERGRSWIERGESPESAEDRRRALAQMRGEVGSIYMEARERADRQGREVVNQVPAPERGRDRTEAPETATSSSRPDAGRTDGAAPAPAIDAAKQARNAEVMRQVEAERAAERAAARAETERREAARRELDRQNEERDRRGRDNGIEM